MLGMVLELLQLRLHGSTQVTALPQQLHLRHHAAQMLAVIPGQGLDLIDVLAQVQNLREIREEEDQPSEALTQQKVPAPAGPV